jgi:Fur family ferric uptake transcriptional regulator
VGLEEVKADLERLCRALGVKLTKQRRIILAAMEKATDHPTADDVYARVKPHKVSQATVYRTLVALARRGVLTQHHFTRDRPMRFELKGSSHHDHLIDARTGRITEFHRPEIAHFLERMAAKLGYRLTSYSLELVGEQEKRR